jgi:hypothetical protein
MGDPSVILPSSNRPLRQPWFQGRESVFQKQWTKLGGSGEAAHPI